MTNMRKLLSNRQDGDGEGPGRDAGQVCGRVQLQRPDGLQGHRCVLDLLTHMNLRHSQSEGLRVRISLSDICRRDWRMNLHMLNVNG